MAPEMIQDALFDPKCDTWSIGCVLYLMLTNVPPFNGLSDSEVIAKIIKLKFQEDTITKNGHSIEALEFIKKLICPLEERMSAEEAIRDPWLKD